jgi:hypothetical protein
MADTAKQKSIWEKKFFWGITFNTSLVTLEGSALPEAYFLKPAMGFSLRTEYYFHKNIGVSISLGYQQKGSGILTPDYVSYEQNLGDGDSTHRGRIKFDAFELPVAFLFRTNEILKGTKIHASIGVNLTQITNAKYVFYSIEDGFHLVENHSDRYYKSDIPITGSLGLDINAGNSTVFQVHVIGNWGTRNAYKQEYFPGSAGKNNLYGLRLGWLF